MGLENSDPCIASNSRFQGLFSARLPEHLDRVLINEWVWSESRMWKAWLCAVLCEGLSMKTDVNLI